MTSKSEVISLLRELLEASGVKTRFGLARRIIESFRGLDARERKAILLSFGVDKAEDFARELSVRKPDRLIKSALEVLERAEKVDPDELLELVESAQTSQGRQQLLERGRSVLDGGILSDDEGFLSDNDEEARKEGSPSDDPHDQFDELEHGEPDQEEPDQEELELSEISADHDVSEGTDMDDERPRLVPESSTEADVNDARRVLDTREDPLISELQRTTSILGRLICLRNHLEEVRAFDIEELDALIRVFPEGWQRRKAAMTLLEVGIPEDESEASTLVNDNFESPADRRWLDPRISR